MRLLERGASNRMTAIYVTLQTVSRGHGPKISSDPACIMARRGGAPRGGDDLLERRRVGQLPLFDLLLEDIAHELEREEMGVDQRQHPALVDLA